MISYGGPELLLLIVIFIVTPIVYRLFLKRLERKQRIICISSLWAITFLIGYTDVIYISLKARKLCREEAGMHVYKTVEAEGILGVTNKDYLLKYGYRYIEDETIIGGKKRYTLKNGEVVKEKVSNLISRYEIAGDSEVLEMSFNRDKDIIRDRQTGEVLGEIVAFVIYPGWLDSRLLGIFGFTWIPPRCDGDYPPERGKRMLYIEDLVRAVIKPKVFSKGDAS